MSSWRRAAASTARAPTASRRPRNPGRGLRAQVHGRRHPEARHRRDPHQFRHRHLPEEGQQHRARKGAGGAQRPLYRARAAVLDARTASRSRSCPDGVMQRMRVGAANGLGVKYLARKDASTVGILGSGWQAGAQLMAACAVREIKTIRCFSPTKANREAFAKQMSELLGVEVDAGRPAGGGDRRRRHRDVREQQPRRHLLRALGRAGHAPELDQAAGDRDEGAQARRPRRAASRTRQSPIHVTTRDLALAKKANEHGWSVGKELDFDKLPTLPELIVGTRQGPPVATARSPAS